MADTRELIDIEGERLTVVIEADGDAIAYWSDKPEHRFRVKLRAELITATTIAAYTEDGEMLLCREISRVDDMRPAADGPLPEGRWKSR